MECQATSSVNGARLALLAAAGLAAAVAGCSALYTDAPRYGRARPRPTRPAGPKHAIEAGRGNLPWPVKGSVAVGFGLRQDPKYGTKTRSSGVDIACKAASPVSAVSAGRVSFADQFMGLGRMVIIEHGGGFHSVYARLAELKTTVGAQVRERQQIGVSRDTLHFELRVGGKPVDPLDWLGRQ